MDGIDIGKCRQFVAVEVVIGVHVAGGDPQDEVNGPCHLEALHHFGEFRDFLFELAQGFGHMVVQYYMAECDEAFIYLFSIQDGYYFFDITLLFQASCPLVDGGYGFMQFFTNLLVGQRGVLLKKGKNLKVGCIKIGHCMAVVKFLMKKISPPAQDKWFGWKKKRKYTY